LTSGTALTFDGTALAPDGTSRTLGTTALRWGTVYATALADGTDQLVGSSSTTVRFGYGSGWTSLSFATAGTEGMRLNSTGLGVGTASPTTKIQANIASATAYTTSSDGNIFTVQNETASGYAGIRFLSEPASGNSGIAAINSFAPATGDSILAFSTRQAATLGERFRIGPSGQLGIGGATYGTAGQVLTSAGSGSAPTWSTPSSGGTSLGLVRAIAINCILC
jgi:hypothetical protein